MVARDDSQLAVSTETGFISRGRLAQFKPCLSGGRGPGLMIWNRLSETSTGLTVWRYEVRILAIWWWARISSTQSYPPSPLRLKSADSSPLNAPVAAKNANHLRAVITAFFNKNNSA
ncbi:hypothetical protein RRG08_040731 [Elysia crispata]|uniref:Uncharacterized protein n=1 Tax=Elysia crispata TaxID=231223 RepID=A0AAE1BG54_9GAST|nr:hypothetical protein RRG08_040731 [Elysia crispata]